MIIYIIAAILIAGCAFLFVQSHLKRKIAALREEAYELKEEIRGSKARIDENYKMASSIEDDILSMKKEREYLLADINASNQTLTILKNSLADKQEQLHNDLAAIENLQKTQREQLESNLAALEASERNKLNLVLEQAQKDCDNKLNSILQKTEAQISECEAAALAAQNKYFSVLEVLNKVEENKNDEKSLIEISKADQNDIDFLLNTVVDRLKKPDILYKLIWTEYFQKPTNQMLDYILPQKDCSGIYKITNIQNGKCYIGRSTSVRKRLTDHIKSAIGISTIADQYIHQVMRKENLWNFRFELIEECEKSDLGSREKYYIDFFNSSNQKYGYNAVGGSEYKE